jgi:hypothetical protein
VAQRSVGDTDCGAVNEMFLTDEISKCLPPPMNGAPHPDPLPIEWGEGSAGKESLVIRECLLLREPPGDPDPKHQNPMASSPPALSSGGGEGEDQRAVHGPNARCENVEACMNRGSGLRSHNILRKRHGAAALHDAGACYGTPLLPRGRGMRQPHAAFSEERFMVPIHAQKWNKPLRERYGCRSASERCCGWSPTQPRSVVQGSNGESSHVGGYEC